MNEICQGPKCTREAKRRSPEGMPLCRSHDSQLRRRGRLTEIRRCVMGCGRAALSNTDVCNPCAQGLKGQGLKWCTNHGAIPLGQFQCGGAGQCKLCRKAFRDANPEGKRCVLECGRMRKSRSDICSPCASDLAKRGLGRCNTHGELPLSDFFAGGKCSHCNRERKRRKHATSRSEIVGTALANQGGACKICIGPLTLKTARIDHDHSHGCSDKGCPECRRSLLCDRCNAMLGRYCDDPVMMSMAIGRSTGYSDSLLRAGIDYLDHWNSIMVERGVRKRDILAETVRWMSDQLRELVNSEEWLTSSRQ